MFTLIAAIIHKIGLTGVGLLMLVENLVPIIPSELIMPMAGFEAARGSFSPLLVILVGTLGSIVGALPWYWVGRTLGIDRLTRLAERGGRWLTLSPREITRGEAWFRRWGVAAVFIGRCLPGVRGMICLPAGIARMPFPSFLLWSSLGALAWTTILTTAGFVLQSRYVQVDRWLNPVTDGLLAFLAAAYVIRVVRYRPAR